MRRKLPGFEIALCAAILAAYLYGAFSDAYNLPNRWFTRDDAYYYYKVAQNIGEGRGSTFDGVHPSNGYHPLWMLVCIPIFALARYDLILPLRVLLAVTGVLQAGTATLLYRLIRSVLSPPVAALAGIYWASDSYLALYLYQTGVESSLALFLIVLLLTLVLRFERAWRGSPVTPRQIAVLGTVAALVVFARLDLIFFGLIMGIWIVLRNTPLRYLLPLDMLACFVASLLAVIARLGLPGYYEVGNTTVAMGLLNIMVNAPLLFFAGLYRPPSGWSLARLGVRCAVVAAIGSAVTAAVMLAAGMLGLMAPAPRIALLYNVGLTSLFIVVVRLLAYFFREPASPQAVPSPVETWRANWRTWLGEGAVYYGILGGALAAYMLWSKLSFGTFSPVSGQIKRWWGSFLMSVYGTVPRNWPAFFGLDTYGDSNAWSPAATLLRQMASAVLARGDVGSGNPAWQLRYFIVLAAAALLGMAVLWLARKRSVRGVVQLGLLPLLVGSWLQVLSYNATGYASMKEWYWLTEPVFIALLAAVLLDVPFRALVRRWRGARLGEWALVAAYGVAGLIALGQMTATLSPYGQRAAQPYPDVVPFLEQNTPPGAVIGMTGGGNVGYFLHNRTIVNMDGLINSSSYFTTLKEGSSAEFLYDSGMRYVFANPDLLAANPYRGMFAGRLESFGSWGGKQLMRLRPGPAE